MIGRCIRFMTNKEEALIRKLVEALRRARPHVYALLECGDPLKGGKEVISEMDCALIEADEVVNWSGGVF